MPHHDETRQTTIDRRTALDELPQFLTVREFEEYMNVGRTTAYEFARDHGIRIGRSVRIPRQKLVGRG